MNWILNVYISLFGVKIFRKLNYFLFKAGLKGLGYLNYGNLGISGEEQAIKKIIAKLNPKTFFDVGANIGSYGQMVHKLCPTMNVFCFEPHPVNYKQLSDNTKHLELIQCYNIGFSDEKGKLELFDYANDFGSSHATIYKEVIEEFTDKESKAVEIDVFTIDDFIESEKIPSIDLLKIDTEGHEYKILQGAKNALKNGKIKVIQFEIGPMNIISRVFLRDFIELLSEYKLYRILRHGFLPIDYKMPYVDEVFAYSNIVAIHNKANISLD